MTPQSPRDQFIDQMTRKLLVDWCDREVRELPPPINPNPLCRDTGGLYAEHAKLKGWVSKDGTKILSAGYQTAARFLKR